ncbi:terminase gpA endonuclease subunit [Novosphingobium sp.]|uniref:terminase gpA endonuclease subunit n=1 Tax=Novosphingobium sp. TaxID=1874826 RepID=UPI00286DA9FE|nr:terminase gpA endonuclease subunit [Novosphingobium sp.]
MRVLSRGELAERADLLANHAFCQSPAAIAAKFTDRLLPRESITTLDWSLKHRIIRKPDDTRTHWSLDLTPYLAPIMAALDDPEILEVVVPKPGRCGGTAVAENHAMKRLDSGPTGDIMWYLAGPEEVRSYADRILAPLFEDHTAIASRIGGGKSDNNKTRKRVAGQTFELMVMSAKTTTNRQGAFIVFDEPDSYSRDYRSNFLEQGRQRQRMLGNDRKIYACAHPDIGWSGGISAGWVLSTQGIFVMQCPHCDGFASPYPTKYWQEVPRFRLSYTKAPEGTPVDQRLSLAERTAAMGCPHCGACLDEDERREMVAKGAYMHKGQELDIKAGIIGEPDANRTWGFWIHVLMAPQVGMGELARELEGAIEHKERTGKSDKLKQVMVRTFGEVFEGAGDAAGLDARFLKSRTKDLAANEEPVRYRMGEVPAGVKFIVASVDVGGGKFDVLLRGFDLQRRSWLLDRFTIRQREHGDGIMRDITPSKVQDDWTVLESQVIDRLLPMQGDPAKAMPVALTVIDASDGNVTWKAYEFARRMDRKRWGSWRKVRCIKGATTAKAPPLPVTPTTISRDNDGKPLEPKVTLHMLGVHQLKESVVDDLAISDGSPGQCFFALDTPDKAFEEFFNEVLIDGKWVRNGPQESLDLYAYSEAGRLMLEPDRKGRDWAAGKEPPWATPISLTDDGEPATATKAPAAAPATTQSFADKLNQLDQGN